MGVVAPVVPPPAQAQTPPPVRPGAPAAPGVPAAANAPVDPRTLPQHLDQLRGQRQETQEGNRTVIREGDRTIIREGGRDIIRHDEAGLFRYNAREVNVERRGNVSVTVVVRPDGSRIVTETDPDGRLIRRLRRDAFGREVIIIDNISRRRAAPATRASLLRCRLRWCASPANSTSGIWRGRPRRTLPSP